MNIFAYCDDPYQSALWLDDVRKNKMIMETAQLLCTAGRYWHGSRWVEPDTYKSTHVNHPCAIWAKTTWANYEWLFLHWQALYEQRGKSHMSWDKNIHYVNNVLEAIDNKGELTPFANCARNTDRGYDFTHLPVHDAYREYHKARWSSESPTWNYGERPEWYT